MSAQEVCEGSEKLQNTREFMKDNGVYDAPKSLWETVKAQRVYKDPGCF